MGFWDVLKKAANPLNPLKQAHKIGKGVLGANKKLLKGDFKGALKGGLSAGGQMLNPLGDSNPIAAAIGRRFEKKLGVGGPRAQGVKKFDAMMQAQQNPLADPAAVFNNPNMGKQSMDANPLSDPSAVFDNPNMGKQPADEEELAAFARFGLGR